MTSGQLVYEVRAVVREDLVDSWLSYMRQDHIPDVVVAGGFVGATLEAGDGGRFRVRYIAPDAATLDRYLAVAAGPLRQHALARFPEGVDLDRDRWVLHGNWPTERPGRAAAALANSDD